MSNLKNTEAKNKLISGFKNHVYLNHPFWGTVIANVKIVPVDHTHGTSIASTDGKRIYIRSDIDLPINDFKFVMFHELLHIAYLHPARLGKRHFPLWLFACDFAVNTILIDEMNMSTKLNVLYSPIFRKKSAEEIYSILMKIYSEIKKSKRKASRNNNLIPPVDNQAESNAGGKGQEEPAQEDAEKDHGNGYGDIISKLKSEIPDLSNANDDDITKVVKTVESLVDGEQEIEELLASTGIGSDLLPPEKQGDIEEWTKSILAKAHMVWKQTKNKGSLPGSLVEYIEEFIVPKIPFDRLLCKYTSEAISGKEEFSYSPIHKRYYDYFGIIYPSLSKKEESKIILCIDTSGSISTEELMIFAGGIKKLSTMTENLTVITADYEVQQVIKPNEIEDFLKKIKFKGRGGTSHIPVFKYIDELIRKDIENAPDVVICFTDGFSNYPEKAPRYPVIWVLTEDHEVPPWGIIIKMDKKGNATLIEHVNTKKK